VPARPIERAPSQAGPVFIENSGQFDPRVRFQVRLGDQRAWVTSSGIVFDNFRSLTDTTSPQRRSKQIGPARHQSAGWLIRTEAREVVSESFDRLVFSEDFVDANCCAAVEGKDLLPGVLNYFEDANPDRWRTGVRRYAEVLLRDVWPGIDLRIYGNGADLEQEFIVRPGGDLRDVHIAYRGIDRLGVAEDGSLWIKTAFGKLVETPPLIYQETAGGRKPVDGRYKTTGRRSYTFDVGEFDPHHNLVIDPTLLYSTFLGGSAGNDRYRSNGEVATGVAADASGNSYVTGYTVSSDYPITPGAFHTSVSGWIAFVSKLDAAGSALVYSAYLSPGIANAIAVDVYGNAYITGNALGAAFPVSSNAYPTPCFSNNGFIAALNASGTALTYATCFPGIGASIAADSNGRAFVAGRVGVGMPTTSTAFQPAYPGGNGSGFVAIFDTHAAGASSLAYSTYLGVVAPTSNLGAVASGIAIDSLNKIYVTGAAGGGLPVTPGAFQKAHSPCHPSMPSCPATTDAFVAKLDPEASGSSSLVYATYLAGYGVGVVGSGGNAIAVDGSRNAIVTGYTTSPAFPVTPGAFQTWTPYNIGGNGVGFVTKVSVDGSSLIYSTYLQSTCKPGQGCATSIEVTPNSIAIDKDGNAYVAGMTNNRLFPTTADAFQSVFTKFGNSTDYRSAFLSQLNESGSALRYSTFLSGHFDDGANAVAVDANGDVHVAGYTSSPDFPVLAPLQPSVNGTGDAFVAKFLATSDPEQGPVVIRNVFPRRGGNAGTTTATIIGTGFGVGAAARLSCPTDIPGTVDVVSLDGQTMSARFTLLGQPPGSCTVVVANPDGRTAALADAFSIEGGGVADLQLELWGRSGIRGGVPTTYLASLTNRGLVDSGSMRIWFAFPDYFSWKPEKPVSAAGHDNDTIYVAFDVYLATASTEWVALQLTAPNTPDFVHREFAVQVWQESR